MTIPGPGGAGAPFRSFLPDRTVDSGRIFRDVDGIEQIYSLLGSDPGLDQWRGEMGVIPVHDLQATLSTQLAEIDAVSVALSPAAANTTDSTVFSFPTLPSGGEAARHRILSAFVLITANVANFEAADLSIQPFGDPTSARIDLITSAEIRTSAIANGLRFDIRDLWGRRDMDYSFRVRSNAGGATSARLDLLVAMVPPGVAVPA